MVIDQFFNSKKKKIDNNVEVIIIKIIKAYSMGNKIHKIDEKDVIIPKVRYIKVMQAFHKLCLYKQ